MAERGHGFLAIERRGPESAPANDKERERRHILCPQCALEEIGRRGHIESALI
jgi:hypothetical protein